MIGIKRLSWVQRQPQRGQNGQRTQPSQPGFRKLLCRPAVRPTFGRSTGAVLIPSGDATQLRLL
jgi:hypothetical protein